MAWVNELPVAAAFAALFAIVMLRANATYWIGRGLRAGAAHSRLGVGFVGRSTPRAERLVASWGPGAVTLSFLTIGLQTAINAGAGAVRMPMHRYLPAVVLGSLIWATIYSALGTALLIGAQHLLAA
ncbi:MAG: VTT domain-containing protein [Micrococcales bacterium]|nr:VTT domain-containing protein [Micrococcales bacterium]